MDIGLVEGILNAIEDATTVLDGITVEIDGLRAHLDAIFCNIEQLCEDNGMAVDFRTMTVIYEEEV